MASLLNGGLAASLPHLPEVRLHVPALTYSWHLHGFPHEWEPCCFPGSSSKGEATCHSHSLQLTFAWLPSLMGALMLPLLLFHVPGLTYSWHLPGFPLEWEPCCFSGSSPRDETTCPSPNLQLTFAWLSSFFVPITMVNLYLMQNTCYVKDFPAFVMGGGKEMDNKL